jgi:hypothetical protein
LNLERLTSQTLQVKGSRFHVGDCRVRAVGSACSMTSLWPFSMLRERDAARIVTSSRSSGWWGAVCFGMALLAACGRAGEDPAMADDGASAPTNSIQLNDFGDYQVVQRMLGGSAQQVSIAGTFTGSSIASVQAQVVSFTTAATLIVSWTDLNATSDGGYSGTFDVPQGGWYRTVVRGLDEGGNEVARADGAHRWGVGMNILCIGQSNMVGNGHGSYTAATDLAASTATTVRGSTWRIPTIAAAPRTTSTTTPTTVLRWFRRWSTP